MSLIEILAASFEHEAPRTLGTGWLTCLSVRLAGGRQSDAWYLSDVAAK